MPIPKCTVGSRDMRAISGFADYQEVEHIQLDKWIDSLRAHIPAISNRFSNLDRLRYSTCKYRERNLCT